MQKLLLDHPWIIILLLLWVLPWKGAALWRSARKGAMGWFVALLLLNTLGVLDILYLFVFSSSSQKKQLENLATPVRQPRIASYESEEFLQKKLLEKQRQRQELEARQARYVANKRNDHLIL